MPTLQTSEAAGRTPPQDGIGANLFARYRRAPPARGSNPHNPFLMASPPFERGEYRGVNKKAPLGALKRSEALICTVCLTAGVQSITSIYIAQLTPSSVKSPFFAQVSYKNPSKAKRSEAEENKTGLYSAKRCRSFITQKKGGFGAKRRTPPF